MARLAEFAPVSILLRWMVKAAVKLLTKPLSSYTLHIPNDIANLKRHIRRCDVVLIEGNERISECIKYLTQSSWSHSALYVGDEPLKRSPEMKAALLERFGEEANHLIVEAEVDEGVILSPLSKYRDFNLRVCRPWTLSSADAREVVDFALSRVGYNYDLKNIIDLARYFLPVSLIPRRWRHHALQLGSGDPTRVICSSLVAECFQRVRFPVLPRYQTLPEDYDSAPQQPGLWRMLKRPSRQFTVMKAVPASLITPRDFDLSPYFEVIKFNVIENLRFDYHKILWVDEEDLAAPASASAAPKPDKKSA